tara:strand:- start:1560 stop:3392 length:1833 start_codon:yes stop_codon:yes gene_type:complete
MEEGSLAVVILPTYHDVLQNQNQLFGSCHAKSEEMENTGKKNEDLAIVILPNYLDQHESIRQPPAPPVSKKKRNIKALSNRNEVAEWKQDLLQPVNTESIPSLPRWKGHLLLGRKKYRNFVMLTLAMFLSILILNVVIGPINGAGGDVRFDGGQVAYSPLNDRFIEVNELYPCDPKIQSTGCRNTLTPFFQDSNSMPQGIYIDTVIPFFIVIVAMSSTVLLSKRMREQFSGARIEQAVGFDPRNPRKNELPEYAVRRLKSFYYSLLAVVPLLLIFLMLHLTIFQIDGEGYATEFDGIVPVNYPDDPEMILHPGDIYACDASIQLGSCDFVIKPTISGSWIAPLGIYPVHVIIMILLVIGLLSSYAISVELQRGGMHSRFYTKQQIGLHSGKFGLEFYRDMITRGTKAIEINHKFDNKPQTLFQRVNHILKAIVHQIDRFITKIVSVVRRKKYRESDGIFDPSRVNYFSKVSLIEHKISETYTFASFICPNPVVRGKIVPLTRLYPFDLLRPKIFKTDKTFNRIKSNPLRRRPIIRGAKTPSLRKASIKARRSQNYRVKFGKVEVDKIPFQFIHVDEKTADKYRSGSHEEGVLFVHDRKDHDILVDLSKLG